MFSSVCSFLMTPLSMVYTTLCYSETFKFMAYTSGFIYTNTSPFIYQKLSPTLLNVFSGFVGYCSWILATYTVNFIPPLIRGIIQMGMIVFTVYKIESSSEIQKFRKYIKSKRNDDTD